MIVTDLTYQMFYYWNVLYLEKETPQFKLQSSVCVFPFMASEEGMALENFFILISLDCFLAVGK